MGGLDPAISLAENYRVWGREARGRSPAYVTLSNAVAGDSTILDFLGTLPPDKRQPNLLFASACYLLGAPADPGTLRDLVRQDQDRLSQVMRARRTQTNEAARCATLLPALAQLPEPLALIEVGASAGLTLLFDRYSYDYGDLVITGSRPGGADAALRPARPGAGPGPGAGDRLAGRAGPQPAGCQQRRRRALAVVPAVAGRRRPRGAPRPRGRLGPPLPSGDPPRRPADRPARAGGPGPGRGDRGRLPLRGARLCRARGPGALRSTVRGLDVVWFSNEAPGVVPGVPLDGRDDGTFVLARDGATALARTDGHGDWVEWHAA